MSSTTPRLAPSERGLNRQQRTIAAVALLLVVLVGIVVAAGLLTDSANTTALTERSRPPSSEHLFGTDRYGRDLLARTLVGLRLSLVVGGVAAVLSGAIAVLLSLVAVLGGRTGAAVVSWLVDLFLALPHLVLLILVAFALGGGTTSVILAVGLTHWPRLTRVLTSVGRAAVGSDFVAVSRALGHGPVRIARTHIAGHLLPHLLVGTVLLFPHAILHEAALSFLGLGIDPGQPAIGILLQESMRYLSAGHWWLAVLPGLGLLLLVRIIDRIGENARMLLDPRSAQL